MKSDRCTRELPPRLFSSAYLLLEFLFRPNLFVSTSHLRETQTLSPQKVFSIKTKNSIQTFKIFLPPFQFGMFGGPSGLLVSGGAELSRYFMFVVWLQGQSTGFGLVAQVGYKMFILISPLLLCQHQSANMKIKIIAAFLIIRL